MEAILALQVWPSRSPRRSTHSRTSTLTTRPRPNGGVKKGSGSLPATLLIDTFASSYPTKRYQSAWIGIVVHNAQSVFFAAILLTFVL